MPDHEPPNRLESAFFQRDSTNSYYEQVNISGSDLIIYHSASGEITADKISVFAAKYGLGGSGSIVDGGSYNISASYASSSLSSSHSETASYAITSSTAITASNAITASYALNSEIGYAKIFLLMGG